MKIEKIYQNHSIKRLELSKLFFNNNFIETEHSQKADKSQQKIKQK